MADTIEAFVTKLQEEGVQAGQQAAEKLQAEAQQQADAIIADAQKQAQAIIDDANSQAQSTLNRAKSEVTLAARDTIAKLRETLSGCLNTLLAEATAKTMNEPDFLGKVLSEMIQSYAQADQQHRSTAEINLTAEMKQKLADWAVKELGTAGADRLKGQLTQAGFEYTVDGGTVEVTLDAVVETLSDMVTPTLREVLTQATSDE